MGFPSQEYWSRLLFPSLGNLPHPGIEPMSTTWQMDCSLLSHLGSPTTLLLFGKIHGEKDPTSAAKAGKKKMAAVRETLEGSQL